MSDIVRKGNSSTPAGENSIDASIEIVFTKNDIEAHADFFPARGEGAGITPRYIEDILKENNISYGINQEAIEEASKDCNIGRVMAGDVVIAKGEPPVDEVPEYVQLNPILATGPTESESGRLDYKDASPFIIVKKDQALAKQKSPKTGKDGINVHGEPVPFPVIRPEGVAGGENTRMEGRYLLSNINGQMITANGIVSVQGFLEIKGPVGYKTGNIVFPGDVIIHGPVSDGFKIYSGGSVTIKQTFDVTDASTKGDLNVSGGIIGRGRAVVKVGGSLNTKFVENCRIACRKTASVAKEIINSNIYSLESVRIEKGRIVGGEVWAINGIRAGGIGKISGRATKIHCGIDFTLEQEKEKQNNLLRLIAIKLGRIRQALDEPSCDEAKKKKLRELLSLMEKEQQKASDAVIDLMGRNIAHDSAVVEVSGEIAEGTLIEICHVALFVTEPLKKVRIRLDKEQGKLVTEDLSKS